MTGRRAAGPLALTLASLLALVSSLLLVAGPTASAAGLPAQLVGDAQVTTLSSDEPVPMAAERMPALAGPAFVAPVIDAGFAKEFSTKEGTFAAPKGDELLFLGVTLTAFAPPFQPSEMDGFAPTLTVTFGSHAVSLPQEPSGSIEGVAGSAYGDPGTTFPGRWLVAVPRGVSVQLQATENGFTQSLDLRHAVRVGSAPVVLYRDLAGPLGLDLRPNLADSLALTVDGAPVSVPVKVKEAVLSYFRLDLPGLPAALPPDEAYLLVHVSLGAGSDPAGDQVFADPPDPTTAVTAQLAGGAAIDAAFGPSSSPGASTDGIYGFVLPAGVTSATIIVDAGAPATVAVTAPTQAATLVQAVLTTPASFPLAFAAPAPPTPGPAATTPTSPVTPTTQATSGATSPATSSPTTKSLATPVSHTASGRRPSAAGTDTVALVRTAGTAGGGAVLVVLGGVFVWRRRGHPAEPAPVVAPPPATLAPEQPITREAPDEHRAGVVDIPVLPGDKAPTDDATDLHRHGVGDPGESRQLIVRVLGPLDVQGTTGAIGRRTVLRALVVLAVSHPRTLTGEELRDLLAADEYSAVSPQTLRSELSRLRSVLPAGVLPDRSAASGYGLTGAVTVDWHDFRAFVAEAQACDGPERVAVGMRALRLVRRPVLGHSGWHGIERTMWEIDAAVEALAGDTATIAMDAGEPAAAAEATRLGLLGLPGSAKLWRLRVAAAEAGSGEGVATVTGRAAHETGITPFR